MSIYHAIDIKAITRYETMIAKHETTQKCTRLKIGTQYRITSGKSANTCEHATNSYNIYTYNIIIYINIY